MSFKNLGLRPEILETVEKKGYIEATPIQKQAIPFIIQGRDILGGAQTGTGKTAAFTLPLLHNLSTKGHSVDNCPRALVITPTRELAAQIGQSIKDYGNGLHVRSTVIFGGVSAKSQVQCIRKGIDILVATPGRLLDLVGQKVLDISHIEVLILDEADRMLDMGFIHDIRKIIKLLPKKRQTLFFSATYSKEIKTLGDTILNNPKMIEVARRNKPAENVDHAVYSVEKLLKRKLLAHLIKKGNWSQVLVFTKTKHGANRLAKQLDKDGIMSTAIHGNKSQGARTRALAEFKACKVRILVATDIAARGLDIDRLPYVVNFDLPHVAEDYIHRIGRTGRAGSTGKAISLVSDEEMKLLRAVERLMKKVIPVKCAEDFTEDSVQVLHRNKPTLPKHSKGLSRSGKKSGFQKNKFKSYKKNINNYQNNCSAISQ